MKARPTYLLFGGLLVGVAGLTISLGSATPVHVTVGAVSATTSPALTPPSAMPTYSRAEVIREFEQAPSGSKFSHVSAASARLTTVDDVRMHMPKVSIPNVWPGDASIWVVQLAATGMQAGGTAAFTWDYEFLGGSKNDPLYGNVSGDDNDVAPTGYGTLSDSSQP